MPDYLDLAHQTQRFTFSQLGELGGAASCERAKYLSYRRSDVEPQWADLWYIATQIGADAALLGLDPSFGHCTIDKAGEFIDRFRDRIGDGGYFARGSPDGSVMLRPDKYDDDQGHLGLM